MTAAPTAIADLKEALRRQALGRRAALPPTRRIEAGLALAEAAEVLDIVPRAVVSGFWPIRDEIDPRPLMARLQQAGHQLCLPVVRTPHMIFRRLDRETRLVPAGFGTVEPEEASPELRPDVLLVPLAAFDRRGGRLGYGKGHYDTAIAALERLGPVRRIGLAFSVQEVDHVPTEPHDQPLEAILTEAGYRRFDTSVNT